MDSGATIPDWSGRRVTEALAQMKSRWRRRKLPCCICGQRIDYSLPSSHPHGCTIQHVKSRRDFPQLTWVRSNWEPAHRECNSSAGAGDRLAAYGIDANEQGTTSTDW